MKLAVVHSYYSGRQPSGENVVVDAQVLALREHGIEVRLIAARTDTLEKEPGYRLRAALNVATSTGPSPLNDLEEFGPDLVHVHNLFPNWGTSWLRKWEGPLVATMHNFRPVCAAGTLFRDGAACTLCPDRGSHHAVLNSCYRSSAAASIPLAIRNRAGVRGDQLLQRADNVIVLSERAGVMYQDFGLPVKKISIVPNFVEDAGFHPEIDAGDAWVYIGRLTEEKGIRNLILNWPSNESLNIYGSGPLTDLVRSLSNGNPKINYHGQLDHSRIADVLASSRGLVFPSEWAEGLPLVYAEGLASGRAVVAKSGNSAADDVLKFATGEVFDTWEQLAGALSRANSQLDRLGVAARRRYESAYRRETWVRNTLDVYEACGVRGPESNV